MSQTYPFTFMNCSTCDSWQGNREIDSSGMKIMVESPRAKGKCDHQEGEDKLAFMRCSKWSSLRN